ncbi:FAD-dependent monooxygenase, partial [Alicyclobacillus fructus]|uniref:FAD-dependent monooxygenase n=1 Tax=Alicyclobacillus fructus TaxID=2816082 RepID=UPI002E2D59A7
MKLGIVGAGVAGLAAALACARAGIAYELLDRAAQPLAGGVALTLWPNALRALCDLGVDVRGAGWAPIEEGDTADMRGRFCPSDLPPRIKKCRRRSFRRAARLCRPGMG